MEKSFVFVTDDSFHRSITMHFRIDWFFSWKKWTLFGAWKNRICSFTSHDATFLFSLLIVMSKSTTTILYFVHMRWAIHVKKQLILSPSSFLPSFFHSLLLSSRYCTEARVFFYVVKLATIFICAKMNHFQSISVFSFNKEFAVAPQKDS